MPSFSASSLAPPWPKMSERSPHLGQMNELMFSMMPSTGTSTLRNMLRPLRASISARSCGVETMMAPDSGTCCAMVSCTSPVPGGMSITSTSRSPQVDVAQHLGERGDHHRPAPDDGRAFVDQEAHRHGLEAIGLHRPQLVAACDLRAAAQTQQAGLGGPVDVGIQNAGLEADGLQTERKVDGRGRLADSALARGHGDHVLDAGTSICRRPPAPAPQGRRRAGDRQRPWRAPA